jgi:hypothetical protein
VRRGRLDLMRQANAISLRNPNFSDSSSSSSSSCCPKRPRERFLQRKCGFAGANMAVLARGIQVKKFDLLYSFSK